MKLFISHASEDQKGFVLPLAEALKPHFDVWYAPWELVIGDSLLQKIDQALASSDYGIVVLSPSFFAKKWTRAELDGLFALEDKNRKVILPIWKDVNETAVKSCSPILAGRLAVLASDGIERIVAEIKRAIQVGQRFREISQAPGITERFRRLASSIESRNRATQLLLTPRGAQLIQADVQRVIASIKEQLKQAEQVSPVLKFEFPQIIHGIAEIWGNGVGLVVDLQNMFINSAHDASLSCQFWGLGKLLHFGEREPGQKLEEFTFQPDFGTSDEVVWRSKKRKDEEMSSDQLVMFLLDRFYEYIEKRISPKQR